MFVNTQGGGMNFAFPDVCNTPMGPVPVPIPYPNFAPCPTADIRTTAKKITIDNMPVHTLRTVVPVSFGDNPGVLLGVVSGNVMGACRRVTGSIGISYENIPAVRFLDVTMHNCKGAVPNMIGLTIAPSQTKLLALL